MNLGQNQWYRLGDQRELIWTGLVAKSCLTHCDPKDCSPPGFSVHRISQETVLEWVAISLSKDLPDPGIEPVSPALASGFLTTDSWGRWAGVLLISKTLQNILEGFCQTHLEGFAFSKYLPLRSPSRHTCTLLPGISH